MNATVNTTLLLDILENVTVPQSSSGSRPEPGVYTDVKEWIWKIVPPLVIILGTFGNSLTIVVLLRQARNLSSTAVYLLILAFSDLLILYLGPIRQWIKYLWKTDVRTLTDAGCKIQIFLTYFSAQFSSWLLVAVTIERAISVIYPHKVKLGCTTTKASISVLTIFICIFGLNAHFFYGYGLTSVPSNLKSTYQCIPLYDEYRNFRDEILPWIDFTVTFLVPFLLLSLSNVIIIVKLKRSARRRRKMSLTQTERAGRSVTLLLIVLCVVFFICLTPVSIYLIIMPHVKENAMKLPFQEMVRQIEYVLFWHALTNCFSYINATTNFIFYFLSGSRYRSEVRALFTCKNAGKEGVFGNSTVGRSTSITNTSSISSNPGSRMTAVTETSGMHKENKHNVVKEITDTESKNLAPENDCNTCTSKETKDEQFTHLDQNNVVVIEQAEKGAEGLESSCL